MAAQLFRLSADAGAVEGPIQAAISPEAYIVDWYNDHLKSLACPPDRTSIHDVVDR